MKKTNRLVALLLAAVMVLGMMPAATAHAHENHTHAVELNGIEEYPVLALDTPTTVTVAEEGYVAYFTFTPEVTEKYHFYSVTTADYADTYGALYDADMNLLVSNDDSSEDSVTGYPNFCVTEILEAGKTYVYTARLYSAYATGEFSVTLTAGHDYTSVVTKDATCTEDGVRTYTCSYCGESYDEPIPAGHVYGEDGFCTVCGEEYMITGTCGDDLTWTLNWAGTLTISGTGAMYDYVYSYSGEGAAPWDAYTNQITGVVLEEGVTTIGNSAFLYCRSMTEISLPSTLVSIGEQGLSNTNLTAIELPEGLTTIGNSAFNANYSLASINLPSTLTTIGDSAFYSCSSLTELVIPESVTTVGSNAFYQCGNLVSVTLPDTMTAIPEACFGYCRSLTDIDWPSALTSIGSNAFYGCSGMGHLLVPEGVTYIDQYAFGGGPSKITLPSTLTELADYALASCWSLSEVFFTGDAPTMGANTFNYTTTTAWYPEDNATWTADVQQNYGGTVTWKALCADHDFTGWTTVEATCEVGEYMTRSCKVCGTVENGPEGEPLGHDLVTVHHEPDCGSYSYGYDEITCTRCDYFSQENWVAPEHAYETVVTAPTCEYSGYTTYTCTKCGSSYDGDYTSALGHNVAEWSEPSEATCEEDGVRTGLCSNCNEIVTEKVTDALGHTWDEENPVENADGTMTYTCLTCGSTYTTESPYLYLGDNQFTIPGTEGEATKTFTAEETGALTITTSDMYYVNAWSGQWTTLAIDWVFNMGMFSLEVNGEAAEYTIEGSETAAKIITSLEVNAGDVVTVRIDHVEDNSYYGGNDVKVNMNLALVPAHTHSYVSEVTEPTCTEGGYTTYTCECGDSYVADETDALGHTWVDATCTAPKTCSVCGVTEGEALGHTFGDWFVTTEPTCTEDGMMSRSCDCGETETTAMEALGHDFVNGACTRCDAVMDATFTDVPVGSFFFDPVEWAVEKGITTGATDTTFDPNGNCLRAAVVTFLWRAAGSPEPTTTENPFTDVAESDFFYKAVLWAVENGITNGTSATEFSPYKECNRAQVVTFLWRAMGEPESDAEVTFTDVEDGLFYSTAVAWAVEKKITNGMGDGTFGVNGTCNRAQVVTFLYRLYN